VAPLLVVVAAATRVRARQLRAVVLAAEVQVVEAVGADDAATQVARHRPDVVLLDLDPASAGLDAVERIMAATPTPIVLLGTDERTAQAAVAAGAVHVVGAVDAPVTSPGYGSAVRRQLRFASRVRVITHPRARLRARGLAPRSAADIAVSPTDVRLVVIGASTGGPPALATILRQLPLDLPVPVLVVQHMADGFVEGLAHWLDSVSPLPVQLARSGLRLLPGEVVVAPAGQNLVVRAGLRVELEAPAPGQFHVPSIDATLGSAALVCGGRALGVLLTGMGKDGAEGLRSLRDAGGLAFAQDETTSAVWGMPSAAAALDAVDALLPLPDIAPALVDVVYGVWSGSGP
jgi:two-component system chemotaxis response regulator CheB